MGLLNYPVISMENPSVSGTPGTGSKEKLPTQSVRLDQPLGGADVGSVPLPLKNILDLYTKTT
jgi:hypothetical protein